VRTANLPFLGDLVLVGDTLGDGEVQVGEGDDELFDEPADLGFAVIFLLTRPVRTDTGLVVELAHAVDLVAVPRDQHISNRAQIRLFDIQPLCHLDFLSLSPVRGCFKTRDRGYLARMTHDA